MATFVKRSSSQGLLLLTLVLLAFSVIPAPISGQSLEGRKSKMTIDDNDKGVIHDDNDDDIFNGCHYNKNRHYETEVFCCSKDNLCWGTLPECAANCPCKINCG